MSCDHPEHIPEMYVPAKGGTIILTKNDRYKIRTGKVLEFHFHGSQFRYGRITFFVSNRKNCVQQDSKLGKSALQTGEVCPIIVDKEELDVLTKGLEMLERIIPCDPQFSIIVCTSEQWSKAAMEKNKI